MSIDFLSVLAKTGSAAGTEAVGPTTGATEVGAIDGEGGTLGERLDLLAPTGWESEALRLPESEGLGESAASFSERVEPGAKIPGEAEWRTGLMGILATAGAPGVPQGSWATPHLVK